MLTKCRGAAIGDQGILGRGGTARSRDAIRLRMRKTSQKRGTLLAPESPRELHPVVQLRMVQHFKTRAHRTAFRIVRALKPRATRAWIMAPAHMAHGSSVT